MFTLSIVLGFLICLFAVILFPASICITILVLSNKITSPALHHKILTLFNICISFFYFLIGFCYIINKFFIAD